MTILRFSPYAALLVLVFGLSHSAHSECPPCFKDLIPMQGHGAAPDGSGRRVINVAIDSTWDDTPGHTNNAIWNGIFGCPTCNPPLKGAIDKWNEAPGGSYFFKQVGTNESPDIIFTKGALTNQIGCAEVRLRQFPYSIVLPPGSESYPHETLASRGAHEVGHTIGLEDVGSSICKSIMNGAGTSCADNATYDVQNSDMQSSNQNVNDATRSTCSSNVTPPAPNYTSGYQYYSPQGNCSAVFLTTSYYYCNLDTSSCVFLGSVTDYLYSYCR